MEAISDFLKALPGSVIILLLLASLVSFGWVVIAKTNEKTRKKSSIFDCAQAHDVILNKIKSANSLSELDSVESVIKQYHKDYATVVDIDIITSLCRNLYMEYSQRRIRFQTGTLLQFS